VSEPPRRAPSRCPTRPPCRQADRGHQRRALAGRCGDAARSISATRRISEWPGSASTHAYSFLSQSCLERHGKRRSSSARAWTAFAWSPSPEGTARDGGSVAVVEPHRARVTPRLDRGRPPGRRSGDRQTGNPPGSAPDAMPRWECDPGAEWNAGRVGTRPARLLFGFADPRCTHERWTHDRGNRARCPRRRLLLG
jgi:hypothetical protein